MGVEGGTIYLVNYCHCCYTQSICSCMAKVGEESGWLSLNLVVGEEPQNVASFIACMYMHNDHY